MCGNWQVTMKNIILSIAIFTSIVLAFVNFNTSNRANRAEAQVNYDRAECAVKTEFKNLTNAWGDREDIDTLISNNEWQVIRDGEMSADQMIAMAQTVETSYKAGGKSSAVYSTIVNDEQFKQAVEDYTECKKRLDD